MLLVDFLVVQLVPDVLCLVSLGRFHYADQFGCASETEVVLIVMHERAHRVQGLPITRVRECHLVLTVEFLIVLVLVLSPVFADLSWFHEGHNKMLVANLHIRILQSQLRCLFPGLSLPIIGFLADGLSELGLELMDGVGKGYLHAVIHARFLLLHLHWHALLPALGEHDTQAVPPESFDHSRAALLLVVSALFRSLERPFEHRRIALFGQLVPGFVRACQ
mmetsp:Transcript_109315/g.314839  ORF Transcript_109315/g.314839 Transcript_109315/m.314839 type:complete len:221 (-) Transcript_109315:5096-5758(-)